MNTASRLIDQFVPENYNLSISMEREARTFHGTLTVTGELSVEAHEIILHAKDLKIASATVDGKAVETRYGVNDEIHITHADLGKGKHVVVIAYSGVISDAMHGLYPCYFEHDGVKKELLATQLESHHAREVFPCIDEPEAKATFDISLTTETNITVLGNMPVKSQQIENELLVTTFDTTPRMSTYLVAWVAGEMHKKTAKTKRDVEVNVWATPAQPAASLDFALDIAVRTIEFYEEYFGTNYPLPKADHVALPDFTSGAMENWGLITYREVALLADPATTSISSKQYVASVIAHELAHQWFGNLVTMKWWNNLWLNESFATLMTYVAIDGIEPDWNIWLDFTQEEAILALRRDSIDGVQSVQVDVHHPDEISTLFDGAIVYAKGARLLRMLQQYVGDVAFQSGLKEYFKDFAYKNTEGDDLWNAIATSSGKDITHIMNTWISQPGYPVLHVSQNGDQITLRQEQFFVGPHEPSTRLWPIPLNSPCSEMPTLFYQQEVVVTRHHTTPLRFNVGDSAHFITHYDDVLFARLVAEVAAGTLDITDRLQLLHEATLLARGGVIPSANLITLLDAYKHETSEQVWMIISIALAELRKFVENDKEAEKKLRAFTRSVALAEFGRLGWTAQPKEPEADTKLRATIISLMIYGEDAEVIAHAQQLYKDTPLGDLDGELRPMILSTVVRFGDDEAFESVMNAYATTQSSELREDLTYGLTSTKNAQRISQLLERIKDPSVVRPQDAARWFVYLIRGREGRELAWAWLRQNWQWISDTFSGDKSYDAYPRYSATALSTKKLLDEYIEFFEPLRSVVALTRSIDMGISEIQGRVEIIKKDGPAVRSALHNLK
jgi:aminopeptidase N